MEWVVCGGRCVGVVCWEKAGVGGGTVRAGRWVV